MGDQHGKPIVDQASKAGGDQASPGAGPGAGHDGGVDAAYERFRQAHERYAVAKYEYKAAKYALKAARMREEAASGRSGKHGHRERCKDGKDHHSRHHHRGPHHGADDQAGRRHEGHGAAMPDAVRGEASERRKGRQVVLEVVATERIGQHVQRLTFGGEGFEDFQDNAYTDKYVKILFVDPALGLEPPYDVQALRRTAPKHQRPVRRTYTVHSVDPGSRTLVIDFVVHGDAGVAGPWAARAKPGDRIAFSGPGGKYAPDPRADWHLFVGDTSALPAISAALAALPADAVGTALIEVPSPSDEWDLTVPPGVELTWLHRGMGERSPSPLTDAVRTMSWRTGRVHAFVHGEKSATKPLRRHLLEERGVDRGMLSLSAYWTRGSSED